MSTSESKKQKSPVRYSARNVLVQIFTVCGWMQVRLEKMQCRDSLCHFTAVMAVTSAKTHQSL